MTDPPRLNTKSSMLCDRGRIALSYLGAYDDTMIDHEFVRMFTMATTTISQKFQIVIPKAMRDKFHLVPSQRLLIVEKGRVITLVPEVPNRLRERSKACPRRIFGRRRTDCEGVARLQRLDRILYGRTTRRTVCALSHLSVSAHHPNHRVV